MLFHFTRAYTEAQPLNCTRHMSDGYIVCKNSKSGLRLVALLSNTQ